MSKLVRGLAIAGLASLGSVAFAQMQPTPTPNPSSGAGSYARSINTMNYGNYNKFNNEYDSKVLLKNQTDPAAAYTTAVGMAHCLVKNAKAKSGELLGGPLTDDPQFHRLSRALSGRYQLCNTSASDMPLFVINAALAEELLKASPLPADQPKPDLHAVAKFYQDPAGNTIDSVGRCLAAMSPNLVYQLVTTTAGSPEEKQALNAAYSKTPDCGVPAPPADIPVAEQRSALTTGLYYWVHRAG